MSSRRGSNRSQNLKDEVTTVETTTATKEEEETGLPVVAFVIAAVCVTLLIVFIIGFYCYRKKRHQSGTKIGLTPETPPPTTKRASSSTGGIAFDQKSIESLRYSSPTKSEQQRVFSIDSERGLPNRSQEELFKKSSKAREIEAAQSANRASTVIVEPTKPKSGFFSGLLSGRSSPLSCFGRGKADPEALMQAAVHDGAVEGQPGGKGLKAGRSGRDNLLPPIEGQVPFNRDLDAISDMSDDDTKSDISEAPDTVLAKADSGFVDQAGQRSVSPAVPTQTKTQVLAAFGTLGKKEPPAPSKPLGNPLMMVASKMTEQTHSSHKKGGRKKEAGCQTSPFGSSVNIPGLVESPDVREPTFDYEQSNERKYFIYLISDNSGGFFKKDCVGRVLLPPKSKQLTLSELRDNLARSEDEELRSLIRANRQFRFVTETYKFVPTNETIAPVDDIYPTQGIFIKFTENPVFPETLKSGLSPLPARKIMPSFLNLSEMDVKVPGGPNAPSPLFQAYHPPSYARPLSRQDRADMDQHRSEILRRRHIECVSPLPLKHKEAQRKHKQAQAALYLDVRKKCDNPTCNQRPLFRCARCSVAAYCSAKCKKDHWFDHRLACSRPPWRC